MSARGLDMHKPVSASAGVCMRLRVKRDARGKCSDNGLAKPPRARMLVCYFIECLVFIDFCVFRSVALEVYININPYILVHILIRISVHIDPCICVIR